MSEKIEIRDLRERDWIWTSKLLVFSKISDNGFRVYCALAGYANNHTQKAFPGIETLREKLNKGRNSIIRGIQELETLELVKVEREAGKNNIYYLLDIPSDVQNKKADPTEPEVEKTPKTNTMAFFKGVADLAGKLDTEQATAVRTILTGIAEKYTAPKGLIWAEVRAFERYWTEKNKMGTKERWQMQDTFEVDRRLVTWFSKKKEFAKKAPVEINRGKRVEV